MLYWTLQAWNERGLEMRRPALFLSIKPIFANLILDGAKTVELRRVRPRIATGDIVLIYSASPEMAVLGTARVSTVLSASPRALWGQVKPHACVSRAAYDDYFGSAATATGIRLRWPRRLALPIGLRELRERWPWLKPPQSYRYVEAQFATDRTVLTSLAPWVVTSSMTAAQQDRGRGTGV